MGRATVEDIGVALSDEVTDWRERQIDAFRDAAFPQIAGAGDSEFLKSTAWLNFGVDATASLFPDSSAASIITALTKRFAIPLYVLGLAQDGFKSVYDEIIKDHNRQLTTRFETLRDDFIRRVQTISRGFRDSVFGQNCIGQIQQYLGNREFRDGNEINSFCRRLIHAANIVETDPEVLREKTNAGFANLCDRIYKIYLGSRRGPGGAADNEMYYAKSPQPVINQWGTYVPNVLVTSQADQDWLLAHAWQMDVTHIDEPWFVHKKSDRSLVVRVNEAQSPVHLADSYSGETLDLADAERNMRAPGK